MEEEIRVYLALYYTETSQEYAAAIDVSNLKRKKEDQDRVLYLTEYADNTQFNNLETIIIQNNVNIVYTYGSTEKGKLMHISKLLEQLNIELKIVKKSDFTNASVEHDLSVLIGQPNLNLYPDILAKPLAMKAAGVLINQLKLCSGDSIGQYAIQSYSISSYMRLDNSALLTLNIFPTDKVKDHTSSIFGLLNSTVTAGMGERLLSRWLHQPLVSCDEINQRLDLVELFSEESDIRYELRNNCLKGIIDVEKLSRRLETKVHFRLQDLYVMYQAVSKLNMILVRSCLQQSQHMKKDILEEVFIQPIQELIELFHPFIEMTDKIIDQKALLLSPPEFMINPSYDPTLHEIAERRNEAYNEIARLYETYKEQYPTIDLKCEHNARFGYCFRVVARYNNEVNQIPDMRVLQVLKNGIYFTIEGSDDLHTPSEEYEACRSEYNNAQKDLVENIVNVARTYLPLFHTYSSIIAQLDVLLSFAEVSSTSVIPFTRPTLLDITKNNYIHIKQARHPLLEIQSSIQFIPNDYDMKGKSEDGQNVVIITGPNMGGKSTYMRQLGILAILAQIGCFIPAESAEFPPFTALFTRIGASDNQSRGVSTFMSEMIDMSNILNACERNDPHANSLIIVDELGRGTSTYDGLGLSWGILEYIIQSIPSCYCLFTTHYYELTTIAKDHSNVKNIHVSAISRDNYIAMMYGVHDGPSDKSFGINVAKICNFPPTIIKDAQKKVWELEAIAKANSKEKSDENHKRVQIDQLDEMSKRIHSMLEVDSFTKDDVSCLIQDLEKL